MIFNASETWDLENQVLTYSWNSSLDGSLIDSCLQGVGSENNKSFFIANNQGSGCLSDGTHDITLEVCDISNNCAAETRRIELKIEIETEKTHIKIKILLKTKLYRVKMRMTMKMTMRKHSRQRYLNIRFLQIKYLFLPIN